LPLKVDGGQSESFSLKTFGDQLDASAGNFERSVQRENAKKVFFVGLFVTLVGIAVFSSAKKDKGEGKSK
jgi:hypothetical protein